jgi:hypothetical protein
MFSTLILCNKVLTSEATGLKRSSMAQLLRVADKLMHQVLLGGRHRLLLRDFDQDQPNVDEKRGCPFVATEPEFLTEF